MQNDFLLFLLAAGVLLAVAADHLLEATWKQLNTF